MDLEDLKEQLKEQSQQILRRIQDSSLYQSAQDRYDLLPSPAQKLALIFGFFACALLLMVVPLSVMWSTSARMDEFNDYKELTRQLLRVQREITQGPNLPDSLVGPAIESSVRTVLQSANLLGEQITSVEIVQPRLASLLPKGINSDGVVVHLAKLNIRQVVDIGFSLQVMHPTVKLSQLKIEATKEDDHYYNALYELTGLSVPIEEQPSKPEDKKNRRGK